MKPISILGIGYVGMIQIACFAENGIKVIANDNKPAKNQLLRNKEATIVEPGLQKALEKHFGNISVADSLEDAIKKSDITYICVGTPSNDDGSVNLDILFSLAKDAGEVLRRKDPYHIFVVRSTVPVGTCKKFARIIEEQSGKKYGEGFGCIMHPEFLREGSGMEDFEHPSFTIFGTEKSEDAEKLKKMYGGIGIKDNIFILSFEEAEIFKYLNNNFHALKVSFANEVARIAKKIGVDATKLMKIFTLDKKLNISPYYLLPGMPFGGYCLPKDTKGLRKFLEAENIAADSIFSTTLSNESHFAFIFGEVSKLIESLDNAGKSNRVGIAGVAFKKGVDDIRESPFIRLFQFLSSRGFKASFYDPLIDEKLILGANLKYVQSLFRNFFEYQTQDAKEFIENNDFIVIGCGNGLDDLINHKNLLKDKKIICLDAKFYEPLDRAGMKFYKIF